MYSKKIKFLFTQPNETSINIFFSIINLFPQSFDSVKTENHFSITDTTKHIVNDTLTVVDSLKEKKLLSPIL